VVQAAGVVFGQCGADNLFFFYRSRLMSITVARQKRWGLNAGLVSEELRSRWALVLAAGTAFIVLGIFATLVAGFTTVLTMLIFGWVMVFAGAVQLGEAFVDRDRGRFAIELISGVLYLVAGFMLTRNPAATALMLSFLLGPLFLISGVVRAVSAFLFHHAQWGFQVLSGVVTFWVGLIILDRGPSTALWLIGTMIGIEIIFEGIALSSFALWLRKKPQAS
jgi:uncharacterized membrane protein HdeD (DUF308 family)